MASVSPNSTIKFYKNVPLNNRYEDVIYFASESAKTTYFHSTLSATATLSSQSYARHTANSVKVATSMATLINCNYMAFQNSSFEDKWFYAFITDVEYVNNNCTLVTFEIDVFSTYFTDCTLKQCYVEREHSESDTLFSNLVSEDIKADEYIITNNTFTSWNTGNYGANAVYMYYLRDSSTFSSGIVNNIFTGYKLISAECINYGGEMEAFYTMMDNLVSEGVVDKIAAIGMAPYICTTPSASLITTIDMPTTLNGYTPKNNKLYSYPYCYVTADDNCGNSMDYYFENSTAESSIIFTSKGNLCTKPSVITYPTLYNGVSTNYESAIVSCNFPMCSYQYDGFQNYIGAHKNTLAQSFANTASGTAMALSVIGATAKASTAATLGASVLASNAMSAALSVAEVADQKNSGGGTVLSEGYMFSALHVGMNFYTKTIKAQFARIIDEYFSMYGYATKRVKTPNISSRPYWNYTKTIGCTMTGSCPSSAISKMCSCFDNGIRFWKSGSYIGNYSYDNSP